MDDCDGFFEPLNIPFEEDYQDAAVYAVRSSAVLSLPEKKQLILCWFDTTYGNWSGSRVDLTEARDKMSSFLKRNNYDSFEQILGGPYTNAKP